MSPGKGVSAQISGKNVFCGSSAYLRENGAAISGGLEKTLENCAPRQSFGIDRCRKSVCRHVALSDIHPSCRTGCSCAGKDSWN